MAKNSPREKIMLISTGKNERGNDTKYFYTTYKNKRNAATKGQGKLEIIKFDPWAWNAVTKRLGLRVLFKEKKIPK